MTPKEQAIVLADIFELEIKHASQREAAVSIAIKCAIMIHDQECLPYWEEVAKELIKIQNHSRQLPEEYFTRPDYD